MYFTSEYKKIIASLIIGFWMFGAANADVRLPALVSDHMVLQQNSEILVWGWADPGEEVSVKAGWNDQFVTTVTPEHGKWEVSLTTIKAGGPYSIVVEGDNKIKLSDVLLGEVWVCSGQSNMHMPVGKFGNEGDWRTGVDNYEEEIAKGDYPQLRMFTVERVTSETVKDDVEGEWVVCSPKTVAEFSAVGYFFGRELREKLDVPIGLLNTSWGGTPAEAWTKKTRLIADEGFNEVVKRYQYNLDNWDEEWAKHKAIIDSLEQLRETGKEVEQNPRPPIGLGSNKAPYVLYNAMVAPLLNYKIKGVIWYQGESNAQRAWQYRRLFPAMIENWRSDWVQKNDFPFYFVQIAPHRSQNPEIREAQLMTLQNTPNTGMAVTTDIGDSTNIHPTNKQEVGRRLSFWALSNDYGFHDLVFSGPVYENVVFDGRKAIISFKHTGGGLVVKGDSLTHFTMAGADAVFHPANAHIEGDKIVVTCNEVDRPESVRFAWNYFPVHNLYNKEGLPASPFRTDDWPGKTYGRN